MQFTKLHPCTWVNKGRFGSFFVLSFLALGGDCLQMLCLPGFGTHANTQNLQHFRAFPASTQEHSPPKCPFLMANAQLPNRPGFALLPVQPLSESVSTRLSCVQGVWCGFCFRHETLTTTEISKKYRERTLLFPAANPGVRQTLVQRDLTLSGEESENRTSCSCLLRSIGILEEQSRNMHLDRNVPEHYSPCAPAEARR